MQTLLPSLVLLLAHLQPIFAIPLDTPLNSVIALAASHNNTQTKLAVFNHELKCYSPGTFGPRRGLVPVNYLNCLPLLNEMLTSPTPTQRTKYTTASVDFPLFQNSGCLIGVRWPPNTHPVDRFTLEEMAIAAAVTIKGCIETGGYVRRGGVGWITPYEKFWVEVRSPSPHYGIDAGGSANATSTLSGTVTLSTGGRALEEQRSLPDTKATTLISPYQDNTNSVNATTDLILPSPHSTNSSSSLSDFLRCAVPRVIGTDIGYVPQLDCYHLFYSQLNHPDVYTNKAMRGLKPTPQVNHGRCYLEVRGSSERSVATMRLVDIITAAARIVKDCYGRVYEGILFGGTTAVKGGDEFICGVFYDGKLGDDYG